MTDIERFLYEYKGAQNRINELELQLESIEAKKEAQYDKLLGVKQLKHDRISSGPLYNPVVEAVSKLVDVYAKRAKKIARDLDAANGKMAFIEDTVNRAGLSEIGIRYVRLRYFEGLRARQVAKELGYSESRILDYKRLALKKIADYRGFFVL